MKSEFDQLKGYKIESQIDRDLFLGVWTRKPDPDNLAAQNEFTSNESIQKAR